MFMPVFSFYFYCYHSQPFEMYPWKIEKEQINWVWLKGSTFMNMTSICPWHVLKNVWWISIVAYTICFTGYKHYSYWRIYWCTSTTFVWKVLVCPEFQRYYSVRSGLISKKEGRVSRLLSRGQVSRLIQSRTCTRTNITLSKRLNYPYSSCKMFIELHKAVGILTVSVRPSFVCGEMGKLFLLP